jgi:hypothetical protein
MEKQNRNKGENPAWNWKTKKHSSVCGICLMMGHYLLPLCQALAYVTKSPHKGQMQRGGVQEWGVLEPATWYSPQISGMSDPSKPWRWALFLVERFIILFLSEIWDSNNGQTSPPFVLEKKILPSLTSAVGSTRVPNTCETWPAYVLSLA